MSYSMAHHHKKGRIESKKEGISFVTEDGVEEAIVVGGTVTGAVDTTETDTSVVGAEGDPSSPDNTFGFHNIQQQAIRNTDTERASAASNNNIYLSDGGSHQKYSREQNYVAPTTASPTTKPTHSMESLVRNIDEPVQKAPPLGKGSSGSNGGGGGYISGGAHHQKYSLEQNYVEPTTSPPTSSPPTPTPPPTSPAYSLRDVHSASGAGGGKGSDPNVAVHFKYSKEQDGVNPDTLPEVWMSSKPTNSPSVVVESVQQARVTPQPTLDIRRVAPAPEDENGGEGGCRSENGVYGQHTRNGGVVLRYQYELTQEAAIDDDFKNGGMMSKEDGAIELMTEVLPKLEEKINDALIPVFFQECLNQEIMNSQSSGISQEGNGGNRIRRVRMLQDRDGVGEDQHSMLRHKHTNKVVGIEANPVDFPLSQAECTHDPNPQSAHCHRIEGALTLHFPPNYSISTLLSSTTLTTLRAIEEGMRDGSLKLAHEDIRKLHFLESSYDLSPTVLHHVEGGDDGLGGLDDSSGSKVGLILGILIPLLAICCCCAGFFVWRRKRSKPSEDDEVGSIAEEDDILGSKQRQRHEAGQAQVGSSFHSRGTGRGFDQQEDHEEEDTASSDYSSSESSRSHQSSRSANSRRRSVDSAPSEDGSEAYSEYSEYSEHDSEENQPSQDQSQQQEDDISTNSEPAVDASAIYRRYSQDSQQDYYNDGSKYHNQEEEGYRSDNYSTTSSVNPLDVIFENQRREKEKKRKMKKRQKRIRRRYERMKKENAVLSVKGGRSSASSRSRSSKSSSSESSSSSGSEIASDNMSAVTGMHS